AASLLYLGQPFTPAGGGQIQSLATNPRTVSEIVRSEAAVKAAADAAGMRPGKLRGNISTQAIVQTGQSKATTPPGELKVQAATRAKAAEAANALTAAVIASVSSYVTAKIGLLEDQIASSKTELADIDARIKRANDQLDTLRSSSTLSDTEKLIAVTTLNST